ncbi:helix-turn-helix domain-containing protein [uncultured Tateyamaria sp.]|uniref:arsenate reductase/protein-tyrosine-phosphatase family protein n=1 Tax=uncultured Tateyamaria sp. TaxID=455651 RepID=UPI00261E4425|nr:helix-turn-helix domain-containing protein [uncultured Tateyamaria sp.]
MESLLINRLSTLAHPGRMAMFRLLMRRCPDEVTAGEIAQALDLKPSTASIYFSALTKDGLITQRREGTRLLYTVNPAAAREVVAGIFLDCCRGRADMCPPEIATLFQDLAPSDDSKFNVLFVCSGNSARSIFAEAILRDLAGDRFNAFSAGTAPRDSVNLRVLELLKAKGHDVTELRTKGVTEFQAPDAPRMDFVFTVCDRAANEDCPTWAGQPVSGHWGVPPPVKASGTEAERRLAFQHAYGALQNRIAAFTALPFALLDRGTLQKRVDDIGKATTTPGN